MYLAKEPKQGPTKANVALEGTKIHPNVRFQMTGFQWKDVTDFCPVIGISPRISQVELALVYPSIPYSSKRQLLEKAAVACMPERSTWGMPTCSFSNPAELLLNIAYKTEEYSSFENLIRNTINKRIEMEDLTRTIHNGEELSWAARDVHRFLALPSRCERKDSELGEIAYLHCFLAPWVSAINPKRSKYDTLVRSVQCWMNNDIHPPQDDTYWYNIGFDPSASPRLLYSASFLFFLSEAWYNGPTRKNKYPLVI